MASISKKFDIKGDGKVGPQRLISFYDLMQFEQYKSVVVSGDEEAFKDMLWTLGVNIESDTHEIVECSHRPLTMIGAGPTKQDEIWFGPAVIGSQRIDSKWTSGDYVNWEGQVAALTDPSLRAILGATWKQSSADRSWDIISSNDVAETKKETVRRVREDHKIKNGFCN